MNVTADPAGTALTRRSALKLFALTGGGIVAVAHLGGCSGSADPLAADQVSGVSDTTRPSCR